MRRYNSFYQIHKALRALLYETAAWLQQTDFTNEAEAAPVLEQVALTMKMFDHHAATEDGFVLPAIEKYEPSVSTLFQEEHVKDHELSERMRDLLAGITEAETEEEKLLQGQAITLGYTEFMVFNLEHMAKEEDVLNNLLWRYYSDEELQGITKKIIAHVAPPDMAVVAKWMMRGMSNNDIISWLGGVQKDVPAPAFEGLMRIAENELPEQRWNIIREEIAEGAGVL